VFRLGKVALIGLLLLIIISSGCGSETSQVQTTDSPQTTIPPETPAEHFPESPPFPVCSDGDTKDSICPDGVTTYLNENCVDGEWHQVAYIRNPCEPLTTTTTGTPTTTQPPTTTTTSTTITTTTTTVTTTTSTTTSYNNYYGYNHYFNYNQHNNYNYYNFNINNYHLKTIWCLLLR
jgi:hypothetical protein